MAPTPPPPRPRAPDPDAPDLDTLVPDSPPGDESAQPRSGTPSRTLLVVLGAGVVLLVSLVLVTTQRGPVALPAGSPEATVQLFLQSLVDDRPDLSLLAADACGPLDTAPLGEQRLRIVVREVAVDGDTADVGLGITEQYGAGLFDDGYAHDETYRLDRLDGAWRITGFSWPWDSCWNSRQGG